MAANSRVTITLLSIMALLLISLLASPLISTATGKNITKDQYDDKCPGAEEIETIKTTEKNEGRLFDTRSDTFRVIYTVKFSDNEPEESNSKIRVKVKEDVGSSLVRIEKESGSYSFLVSEGAGSYKVKTNITPDRGASYTLTVEDCTGSDGEETRKHPETTPEESGYDKNVDGAKITDNMDNSDILDDADTDIPYNMDNSDILDEVDDDIPANVDKGTIPNEKLPNTGGVPLLGLLLVGGAGIAAVGSLMAVKSRLRRR